MRRATSNPKVPQFQGRQPEIRFRVGVATLRRVRKELRRRGDLRTYRVTTVYLDTAAGTWTQGRKGIKFRWRRYNEESGGWFETKKRIGGQVREKLRQKAAQPPDYLLPIVAVQYTRMEWEQGGVRVTLDRDVRAYRVDRQGKLVGLPIARLPGYVIEVKRAAKVPEFLGLDSPANRSKSAWAYAELQKQQTQAGVA